MGPKEYPHVPMDEAPKLKYKIMTGCIDLEERGRRFRDVSWQGKIKKSVERSNY